MRESLPWDDTDVLGSQSHRAVVWAEQRRCKKAEHLGLEEVEALERTLGEEHLETLTAKVSPVHTYTDQGRWKEAEQLDLQVLYITVRKLGEDHPRTLHVKDSRTSTYMNQGRWEEAKQLELQVIETTERTLGAEHPGTLASNQVNGEKDKHVQSLGRHQVEVQPGSRGLSTRESSGLVALCSLRSSACLSLRWG